MKRKKNWSGRQTKAWNLRQHFSWIEIFFPHILLSIFFKQIPSQAKTLLMYYRSVTMKNLMLDKFSNVRLICTPCMPKKVKQFHNMVCCPLLNMYVDIYFNYFWFINSWIQLGTMGVAHTVFKKQSTKIWNYSRPEKHAYQVFRFISIISKIQWSSIKEEAEERFLLQ